MVHRVKKGVKIEFNISPLSKLVVMPCFIMWIASSVHLFQYRLHVTNCIGHKNSMLKRIYHLAWFLS